jgi:hypothetical protein
LRVAVFPYEFSSSQRTMKSQVAIFTCRFPVQSVQEATYPESNVVSGCQSYFATGPLSQSVRPSVFFALSPSRTHNQILVELKTGAVFFVLRLPP